MRVFYEEMKEKLKENASLEDLFLEITEDNKNQKVPRGR